eukprot:TRINITY_DN7540_c0_g1_i1.p2 TRINITY_DN7540_c0_g1~~TRINITY_DN7540_c0_g1_i1.p2  ORF type:complete len:103 (-),score=16.31 TRINITY_DN7540_c0_g1_i1:62-370(-)
MCLFKKEAQNTACEHPECKVAHFWQKSHVITAVGTGAGDAQHQPLRPNFYVNQYGFNQQNISKILERKQCMLNQGNQYTPETQYQPQQTPQMPQMNLSLIHI